MVSAGLSQPSSTRLLADRLAEATSTLAAPSAAIAAEVDVVELRDLAQDIDQQPAHRLPEPAAARGDRRGDGADGLIAVTPIFTASYSGLFKSFFDVLEADALAGKPVLIGATGGTARHSLVLEHAMRPLFAYLRAVVVPTAVYAASADWGGGEADRSLSARIGRAAEQLARSVRDYRGPARPDPFDEPTPFAELLVGG